MQESISRGIRWFRRAGQHPSGVALASIHAIQPDQGKPRTIRPGGIRVREITRADFGEVSALLGKGIGYSNHYFLDLLERMAEHPTPAGFPKYGRVLEADGSIVGAIILIFSTLWSEGTPSIRCHVTGWCVEPPYRCYAAVFFARDLKHEDVTYINISARADTLPIIEAQGFSKYSSGQFMSVPALQFASRDNQATVMGLGEVPNAPFEPTERELLLQHARNGCICLWCVTPERAYPFVFRPRLFKRILPGAQLVYCRSTEDFVRFAAPIGRFLALSGKLVVRIDSNGPIKGLVGKYIEGVDCRYYRGPRPRLGDLAYTHLAMCPHVPRNKLRYLLSRAETSG
jgi:hypothetical protein